MGKYIVEFIGTFFLVLTVVVAVAKGGVMAPVAIGASLMVMIYAGGHISGGHFNPAVSTAVLIRGAMPAADFVPYIIAQLAGGAVAALIGTQVLGIAHEVAPGFTDANGVGAVAAGVAEFLGTFALAWVVLMTATTKSNEGNSFYGLAIGFTVTAMAYGLGGISGGAFNPAVGLGANVAGMAPWTNLAIVAITCLLGGAAAAFMFKVCYPGED